LLSASHTSEEQGDDGSGSEMAAELCLISDAVAAADNCFAAADNCLAAADSCCCFVVSADVAAAAGVAGVGGDVVDGDGDGGEAPHPPCSTYQTVNTYLL